MKKSNGLQDLEREREKNTVLKHATIQWNISLIIRTRPVCYTINLEIFVEKLFSWSMAAMKINLTKISTHY